MCRNKVIIIRNCYPMQNYTNFSIYTLQLYLKYVKLRLHLIIYKVMRFVRLWGSKVMRLWGLWGYKVVRLWGCKVMRLSARAVSAKEHSPGQSVATPWVYGNIINARCKRKSIHKQWMSISLLRLQRSNSPQRPIPRVSLRSALGYGLLPLAFPFGQRPLVRGVLKNSYTTKLKVE